MKNFELPKVLVFLLLPLFLISQDGEEHYWIYLDSKVIIQLNDGDLIRGEIVQINEENLIVSNQAERRKILFKNIRTIRKADRIKTNKAKPTISKSLAYCTSSI